MLLVVNFYVTGNFSVKMATLINDPKNDTSTKSKSSIVEDFMYGSNVAASNVYIRLGKLNW